MSDDYSVYQAFGVSGIKNREGPDQRNLPVNSYLAIPFELFYRLPALHH